MPSEERVILTPGEVLNAVLGLKREKLMYWALKGYITVKKETRGKRDYFLFYATDLPKIQQAYKLIVIGSMKDKEAFAKLSDGQLRFNL
jgi:hypothetical protein